MSTNRQAIEKQIQAGTRRARKLYPFDTAHPPDRPADLWFQESDEGPILFIVFYSLACRWSRCLGCNLPSKMSPTHIDFKQLMAQVDQVFARPAVRERFPFLRKVIVSNNGSVLDEGTFSSTALVYLVARLNQHLPNLAVLSLESRVEYVDEAELEFIARALAEGETPTTLEVAIGFEAFDERIRNAVFDKGLTLEQFDRLCAMLAKHRFQLKCYFMQKLVPGMSDAEGVADIQRAIDYLDDRARHHGLKINLHLNPTYVARGTRLEEHFRQGQYTPPTLADVCRAAAHGEGKRISIYLGLSDEGLACEGGSFLRPGDQPLVARMEAFNRSQDYALLRPR